jgi:hypothetical protein
MHIEVLKAGVSYRPRMEVFYRKTIQCPEKLWLTSEILQKKLKMEQIIKHWVHILILTARNIF